MMKHASGAVICAVVALPLMGTMTLAGGNQGDVVFTEVQGVREFSGQLIARPLQPKNGEKLGLLAEELAERVEAGRAIMDQFEIIEYVIETDEYIFYLPAGMTESDLAQTLMDSGNFDYVEPNWLCYPIECSNDSRLGSQWHQAKMRSCDAWDTSTGNPSVSIGFCDTGVRTTHEDLLLNRLEGYNAVNRRWENDGGQINDINSHGTWVTGSGAANGNNARGISGIGWDFSHRMLRVTNSGGGGAYLADLTHAARTSIQAGDRVASVSYGGADSSSARSAASYAKSIGGLVCWSAGNESRYMGGSRDGDDLIVVGATTSGDTKASFSNYGPYVDLMAPGSGILTTDRSHNASYASVSGTSFSCPITAGLIALIWSAAPDMTPDEVEDALKQSCVDLGDTGVDNIFGYGRVDSLNAMNLVATMQLQFEEPLYSGSNVTFYVLNGNPSTDTGLFYSIRGEGDTYISALGVTVDLDRAKQAGRIQQTNAQGDTYWTLRIPNVPRSRLAWLQGAQRGGLKTSVITTQVNP